MRNPCRSLALILAAGSLVIVSGRPLGAQAAKEAKPAEAAKEAKPTQPAKEAKPAPAASAAKHVLMAPGDMKWGPAPPGLPAGGQMAVLDGDPSKALPFTLRAKFPDGYRVPPHWHPTDEHLTVISGSLMLGMGDTLNESATTTMAAGAFAKMPRRMRHSVIAKGATEIQVHGVGPFGITYVNPKDDPRTKTTTESR